MAAHGPIVIARLSLVQRIFVVIIAHEKRVVVVVRTHHRARVPFVFCARATRFERDKSSKDDGCQREK